MDLLDVYNGRQQWSEYISNRPQLQALEISIGEQTRSSELSSHDGDAGSVKLPLSPRGYAIALQSGIGALGSELSYPRADPQRRIEVRIERLAGGLDTLNADFHLLMGELIWKLEMRQPALADILDEIRLTEFEREARAYRRRAERAYFNGWYQEAIGDFLEAEKRNYPDFAVHRSIANIYLYHLIDLPRALEYFRKAAKYARPSDARQSAEAHYFAGIVCVIQRQLEEASAEMQEAGRLNPRLGEAHYQRACIAALLGDGEVAIASLEAAIKGDPRYHERAKCDRVFDAARPDIDELLDKLMKPVQDKLAEVMQGLRPRRGYVIAKPEKEEIAELLREVECRMTEAQTYKGGLECLSTLSRVQDQINGLHDLFHKRYQIELNDYVRSVAFSPSGRLLASGLLNGSIKIWDVYTGLTVFCVQAHLASVNSVAFSSNGRLLATASRDKTIKLWDVDSGGEIHTLLGHDAEVRAVAFSPDGNWLVSGSHDRSVRMWRAVTGREAQILSGHKHQVTSVLFSPNGRLIASASLDKTIKLWDATTGRLIRTLSGHTKGVESLAFGPDGKLLASGGLGREIRIWDTSGRQLQTLGDLPNDVTSLAFSPDGHLIAAGSLGKTIKLWRLDAGQVIKTVRFTEIGYNSVAFSPRGEWLAFGSRGLQLWLKVVLTEEEYATVKASEALSMAGGAGYGAHLSHGEVEQ